MPIEIRNIQAHEFIKTTPEGVLDVEASKKLLVEIASASAPSGDYEILLDTRGAHSELSAEDLWALAAELHTYRTTLSRKAAVLVPPERLDHAEYFARCAKERGFQVSAFTSLGDAVGWLFET